MTKKERMSRDIGLTFDFLRQVIDNPKILDKIPNGSTLEFVEKDFPQLEKATNQSKLKATKRKFLRVKSHLKII